VFTSLMWKLAGKFAKTVIPGVIKPLHVLWNEMIAFIFFAFAVIASFNAYRHYRATETDPASFVRFLVAGIFALTMWGFAFGSYRRARKIARQ
jgi:EamA domain-containing membrane protein RarD